MKQLRRHARFQAPAPLGIAPHLSVPEVRAVLLDSEGPADLATDVHHRLRDEVDGVASRVEGQTAVGGSFIVRRSAGGVRVLLLWIGPPHDFWVLSIWPLRKYRKRRRARDLALAADLQPHVAQILRDHPDVKNVVWMTDDEAEAYPL